MLTNFSKCEQEVSKACIGWHDYVGCYAKKKNNEKVKVYESLEIYDSFILLSFTNLWRFMNV